MKLLNFDIFAHSTEKMGPASVCFIDGDFRNISSDYQYELIIANSEGSWEKFSNPRYSPKLYSRGGMPICFNYLNLNSLNVKANEKIKIIVLKREKTSGNVLSSEVINTLLPGE